MPVSPVLRTFSLLLVTLLTGCAATEQPRQGTPGEPTGIVRQLDVEGLPADEGTPEAGLGPSVQAFVSEDELLITTLGSGSCPTVPTITGTTDEGRIALISLEPTDRAECTADLQATTFDFERDGLERLQTVRVSG